MGDRRCGRARRFAGGRGHEHRERRPDGHAEHVGRDAQRGQLGRVGLRGSERDRATAHRLARRPLRQEALLHLLADRLHPRLGHVRHGDHAAALDHRPRAARLDGRRFTRQSAGHLVRDVSEGGAGRRPSILRRDRDCGTRDRAHARRLSGNQHRLALDLLRQRAARHPRRVHVLGQPQARRRKQEHLADRLDRDLPAGLRPRLAANAAGRGQLGRLVRVAADLRAVRVGHRVD